MASTTDIQFVALNLPDISDPIKKNGQTIALQTFIAAQIDAVASVEQALANIFYMLMNEDRNSSLKLGEAAYTRRIGWTFIDAFNHWSGLARAKTLTGSTAAMTVQPGGIYELPWWATPPVIR